MRKISEETLDILKSQNLIGQNKYSYDVEIAGQVTHEDFTSMNTRYILQDSEKTFGAGNHIHRADGKVLFTYFDSGATKVAVLENEDELFLETNKAMETAITVYDRSYYTSGPKVSSMLMRTKSNKLYLFILDHGIYDNPDRPQKVMLYESENKEGTDFQYKKTIYEHSTTAQYISSGHLYNSRLNPPVQLSTGRIILSGAFLKISHNGGNYVAATQALISDDDGETWKAVNIQDNFYSDPSRGIAVFDDGNSRQLVTISLTSHVWYTTNICISNDDGDTWVRYTNFAEAGGRSFVSSGKDGYVYLLHPPTINDNYTLYRRRSTDLLPLNNITNLNNWEPLGISNIFETVGCLFYISEKGTATYTYTYLFGAQNNIQARVAKRDEYEGKLKPLNININRQKGMAASLNLEIDNKKGLANPLNVDNLNYGLLKTNRNISVKQGYGEEKVTTFTGMIDSINMSSFPQKLSLSSRDNLKKALDQTITIYGNQHTIEFNNEKVEDIFSYLCMLARLNVGQVENTGITLKHIKFTRETYADVFQQLADLVSFEYGTDEDGLMYFRKDYQPANAQVAYSFEEGVDITSLSYSIDDRDLYYKVMVYGKSGDNTIIATAYFQDANEYGILPQKIMHIDASEAETLEECQTIANRAVYLMRSRAKVVQFASIGVPWLQIGDFIQVFETSTMSAGVYRITDLSSRMNDKTYTMNITAYFYGDSVDQGELPIDVEDQEGNPTLNLIPDLTSNVAANGGVARASTVYQERYAAFWGFNEIEPTRFWDANTNKGWLEYAFPKKTIIDKYKLTGRQQLSYNFSLPRDWTFEGFDGDKWIVLDKRTNQTDWGVYEEREYLFNNTTPYSKYRINISKNNGYVRTQVQHLGMYYRGGIE